MSQGVPEAMVQLKKMGYLLVVVTNQSGIARGLLTEEDFKQARRRGPQQASTKDRITIRLDHDIVTFFRDQGQGWQTRINDILLDYVNDHR